MLSVRRISSYSEVERLRGPWNALAQRSAHATLFLTHAWAGAWLEHFGPRSGLWLLVVEDGPRLVAVAPMLIKREVRAGLPVRVLEFWENRHVSRSGILVEQGRGDAIRALADYWARHAGDWDMMRLSHVPESGGALAAMAHLLGCAADGGLRCTPVVHAKDIAQLPVTGDREAYLAQRPRKFRKDLRQCARRLEASGAVSVSVHCAPGDLDTAMDVLFAVEDSGPRYGRARSEHEMRLDRDFQRDLARRVHDAGGGYCNHVLTLDGVPCAALHALMHDGVCYGMLTYYDERHAALSPGRYLMARFVEWCFAQPRLHLLDFNGTSTFVAEWGAHTERLVSASVSSTRPYSRFVSGMRALKQWAAAARPSIAHGAAVGRMTDHYTGDMQCQDRISS